MQINLVTLLIALGIAALSGYGFYAANGAVTDIPLANALGSGIAIFVTLAGGIAVKSKSGGGSTVNIAVASWVLLIVIVIEQVIFTVVSFNLAPYIVVTGILVLVHVLIIYALSKAL